MPEDVGGAEEEKERLGRYLLQILAQEDTLRSLLAEVEDPKAKLRGFDYTAKDFAYLAVDSATKALLIKSVGAKLSELLIDADKNWAGKNITNLGAGAYDIATRLAELVTARGSKASLGARLDVSLNEDGTLKEFSGVICMWSGTLATIPAGWNLCDGGDGTPDLRDKFILGCPDGVDPGDTGGTSSHSHTVNSHNHTIGSHSHTVNSHTHSGGNLAFQRVVTMTTVGGSGGDWDFEMITDTRYRKLQPTAWFNTTGGSSPGTSGVAPSCSSVAPGTDSKNHLPPYYKLAFIMKS